MERQTPRSRFPCRPLLNQVHNSGTEHLHHPPSTQPCPTCKSCPTCSFEQCLEETSTFHWDSVVWHFLGNAQSEMASDRKSDTARELHLHCIPAFPFGTTGPSSKESPVHLRRSMWMKGIRSLCSSLHRRIDSPSACHQPSIPTFPSCNVVPNKTAQSEDRQSCKPWCLAQYSHVDNEPRCRALHHRSGTRHGHHQPNIPKRFWDSCTWDPNSMRPQVDSQRCIAQQAPNGEVHQVDPLELPLPTSRKQRQESD